MTEGTRAANPWMAATELVTCGRSIDDALGQAGVGEADCMRLTGPGAGAWTDLVDVRPGLRALVFEPGPSAATSLLSSRGAHVTVVDQCPERRAFRRAAWPDEPFPVLESDVDALGDRGAFDLVVVELGPGRWPVSRMRAMVDALAPEGALVLLCENPVSPLRALDRLRGRPTSGGVTWLGRVVREGERLGLPDAQVFGLLRSALAPTSAFDLAAPRTAAVVLEAAKPYALGLRQLALRLLTALTRWELATMAVPAWLVVLRRDNAASERFGRRTGRISFIDSWEGKVVWGEPPEYLEKRYRNESEADAEYEALTTLAAAGTDLVPRVVHRPAADQMVMSWMPGRTLQVAALTSEDLSAWIGRAAATLARIHAATRHEDGTVLVHGDYWLGNVVVDGDRIVGVIDWSGSCRGRPESDLHFLVESLLDLRPLADGLRDRLALVAERAYAGRSAS